MSAAKMNLGGVTALIVDDDKYGVTVLVQMLRGMGLDETTVVETGAEAKRVLTNHLFDLCIVEGELPDMKGSEVIQWIRHLDSAARFTPIIVLTGYSRASSVAAARDAGAHIVIRKPASPQILYDRIAWAARSPRPFVDAPVYAGPDRRFRSLGPPGGEGRRATDLKGDIGEATEPNMSQEEIDAMIRPTKIFAA